MSVDQPTGWPEPRDEHATQQLRRPSEDETTPVPMPAAMNPAAPRPGAAAPHEAAGTDRTGVLPIDEIFGDTAPPARDRQAPPGHTAAEPETPPGPTVSTAPAAQTGRGIQIGTPAPSAATPYPSVEPGFDPPATTGAGYGTEAPTWTAMPVVSVRSDLPRPAQQPRHELWDRVVADGRAAWDDATQRARLWLRGEDNALLLVTTLVACLFVLVVAGLHS